MLYLLGILAGCRRLSAVRCWAGCIQYVYQGFLFENSCFPQPKQGYKSGEGEPKPPNFHENCNLNTTKMIVYSDTGLVYSAWLDSRCKLVLKSLTTINTSHVMCFFCKYIGCYRGSLTTNKKAHADKKHVSLKGVLDFIHSTCCCLVINNSDITTEIIHH